MNMLDLPQGDRSPEIVDAVIEIPRNSRNKVEYDHDLGVFRVDRVLYTPVRYPGDYGFIPSTLSPDGDALDVLVLVTEPTFTGCVIQVRPIGLLEMTDEAGGDEKILAVPQTDPRFEEIHDLSDLPRHLLREAHYFFDIYKELEGKETAVLGWHGVERAHEVIRDAVERYARLRQRSP
ncbi:MAG: inorganic diphosphatase [Anaerolineae bacterium]|nr:inorganic diphosphatase [Anaerolineae bacterium]